MRHFGRRAIAPALALVLTFAASVRADCPEEIPIDSLEGTLVLVTSYETKEQFVVSLWMGIGLVPVPMTYTSERGVYLSPDGSRLVIECSSSLQVG